MADPKSPQNDDDIELEPAQAEEVEIDTEGGRTDADKKAKPEGDVEAVEEDAPKSREQGDDAEGDAEHKRRGRSAKARREAQRRREAAKDAKIAEYEQRLARLEGGQQKIEEGQRNRDISALTTNMNAALGRVNSYEDLINQATVEGKPAGALVKAMLAAQTEAAQYEQAINWLKSQPVDGAKPAPGNGAAKAAEEQPEPTPHANPATKILREAFIEEHDWIDTDPNTDDPESLRMQEIADQLTQEGIPSSAPRYWRELKQRGAKALPHRFNGGDMSDEPQRRSGPPIGARRDSAPAMNGNKVKLPPEMVAMMKETGQWDDPKRRATIAADYARSMKQQAGAR